MAVNGVAGVQKGCWNLTVLVFGDPYNKVGKPTFSKFIHFDVGIGNRVKFWHDLWRVDSTLKEAFLELYSISCNKGYSIAKVKSFPNLLLHRDIQFSRPIQDWVLEPLTAFMDFLYSLPLKGKDSRVRTR